MSRGIHSGPLTFLPFEIEFSIVISISRIVHLIVYGSPCCADVIFRVFSLFRLYLPKHISLKFTAINLFT